MQNGFIDTFLKKILFASSSENFNHKLYISKKDGFEYLSIINESSKAVSLEINLKTASKIKMKSDLITIVHESFGLTGSETCYITLESDEIKENLYSLIVEKKFSCISEDDNERLLFSTM